MPVSVNISTCREPCKVVFYGDIGKQQPEISDVITVGYFYSFNSTIPKLSPGSHSEKYFLFTSWRKWS